jgi:hypothetical protein
MEHLERVKQEFTRQAATFASSAAITDEQLTRRFTEAVGSDGGGTILDVACGPGIITTALADKARAVVAFDRPNGTLVVADVVSSENADESGLQNAIETLRDPSHVRMLPLSELVSQVEGAGFAIDTQTTWDKPRELDEWMGIVNDPIRVAPLRTLVRALAQAGKTAGMGLSLADGEIVFFHRWHLIVARKPPA